MEHYRIPDHNLDELKSKIERLSRKAAKLGTGTIKMEIVGHEDIEDHDLVKRVYLVTIKGETPKLNGWRMVAKLEHLDGGNLLHTLPGESLPDRFRELGPWCEYCRTKRDRKDTYVVGHDAGRYQQVGSTCLKDFTGHDSPEAVAQAAEYIWAAVGFCKDAQDDDWGKSGGRGPSYYRTEGYLAWVAMTIRQSGWVSRSKALDGIGTADVAEINMMGNQRDRQCPTDGDLDLASKALAWVRNELGQRDCLSDYEWNLVRVTDGDVIETRWIGYAASIIPAYQREIEKRHEFGDSQYQGEVEKRGNFDGLTVSNIIYREGRYGATAIHKMVDQAGNAYTWFCSGEPLEQGQTYSGKATVKSHEEYRGVKQTVLTRCKFQAVANH